MLHFDYLKNASACAANGIADRRTHVSFDEIAHHCRHEPHIVGACLDADSRQN